MKESDEIRHTTEQSTTEPQSAREATSGTGIPRVMYAVFGIIMIIVYVGMGVLLLINFFGWDPAWAWARYVTGGLLIVYGIWRAYRQVKGIDSNV